MTWEHNLAKRLLQAVVGCRCSDDEVKVMQETEGGRVSTVSISTSFSFSLITF